MKKDDALALRERLRAASEQAASRWGFSALADDGKLSHDEAGDMARWAQRLSLRDRWPHGGDGSAPCNGLRYEVWYFPGTSKPDETLWIGVLCQASPALEPLRKALQPAFQDLIASGRYAKRYKTLEPLIDTFYPGAIGVGRRVPAQAAKAEAGVLQFLEDSLKPVDAAYAAADPDGAIRAAFGAECQAYDPLAALKQRFSR